MVPVHIKVPMELLDRVGLSLGDSVVRLGYVHLIVFKEVLVVLAFEPMVTIMVNLVMLNVTRSSRLILDVLSRREMP